MKLARILGLLCATIIFMPASIAQGVTEITIWHIFTGGHAEALDGAVARFQAANPDVRVVSVHQGAAWGDLRTKLLAATAAGTPPTIGLFKTGWVPGAFEDVLMPLDDVIPPALKGDILPTFLADSTFNGVLRTVPLARSADVLFYNTALVPESPRTWDELLTMAQALNADRDGDGRIDRWGFGIRPGPEQFAFLFLQAGGEWFDPGQTAFLVDSPAGIKAMEHLLALREVGLFQTGFFSGPFGAGEVAMYWGSTAGIPFVAEAAAPHGTTWNVAPIPAGPLGRGYSILMSASAGIFQVGTTEAQREAAARFLLFLLSPEEHLQWITQTGYLPYRQSVIDSPEWQAFVHENPFMAGVTEQATLALAYPHHVEWDGLRRLLSEAVDAVLHGQLAPAEALRNAAAEAIGYLE